MREYVLLGHFSQYLDGSDRVIF